METASYQRDAELIKIFVCACKRVHERGLPQLRRILLGQIPFNKLLVRPAILAEVLVSLPTIRNMTDLTNCSLFLAQKLHIQQDEAYIESTAALGYILMEPGFGAFSVKVIQQLLFGN